MNFWEAYQLMKQGVWCQNISEEFPYGYRYANGRWETISKEKYGEPAWNEKRQCDIYEYRPFIVECSEEYGPFYFTVDDLDSTWETVDCSNIPRIEDRGKLKKSPQQAAKDEAERIEWEAYRREHPPLTINLTLADVLNDTSGSVMLKSASDIARAIQDKQNEAIAKVIAKR